MVIFSQAKDAISMQQQHFDPAGESQVCCEGREQHEQQVSGFATPAPATCTVEAPAQHSAEVTTLEAETSTTRPEQPSLSLQPVADKQEQAAPQATPDTPEAIPDTAKTPFTNPDQQQQQQQTAPVKLPLLHVEPLHTAA